MLQTQRSDDRAFLTDVDLFATQTCPECLEAPDELQLGSWDNIALLPAACRWQCIQEGGVRERDHSCKSTRCALLEAPNLTLEHFLKCG